MSLTPITPCLWFNGRAKEAADYYTSIFPNSKITSVQRYNEAHEDIKPAESDEDSVLTVAFEINGQPFVGLNGGDQFQFSAAVSFTVQCRDQEEVDYYWEKLGEGGDESRRMCGWLADKFGVSWQVIPASLIEMIESPDKQKVTNVTKAMRQMKKLDIAALKAAFGG